MTTESPVLRVPGMLTREEADALERVRMSRFFLMRNDGGDVGERASCGRCGLKHAYLTYMCVERPFRGLEDGLYVMFRAARDDGRRAAIERALNGLPDLATGHPFTARQLEPDQPGEAWYSVLLSLPEPISETKARQLAERINSRRPPIAFIL